MRVLQLLITAMASILALAVRPRVELARDSVEVEVSPGQLIEVFRERFAGSPDEILAIPPEPLGRPGCHQR